MDIPIHDSQKLYHTIGEVAQMFDVNASLIRYWEKEFDILKPQKNNKGNRLFKKEDIDKIAAIYHLVKERGYTIQGAKEKLSNNTKETFDHIEIINTLQKTKAFLLHIKRELEK